MPKQATATRTTPATVTRWLRTSAPAVASGAGARKKMIAASASRTPLYSNTLSTPLITMSASGEIDAEPVKTALLLARSWIIT